MSRRAIGLALLGVIGLSAVTFYNNFVIRNTNLIHSYLPVGVFGGAFLFVLTVNPLLKRIGRAAALSASELAGVVVVMMFACGIVGAGILEHATTLAMMPWHWERTQPGWRGDPALLDARSIRNELALRRALAEAGARPAGDPLRALAARLPAPAPEEEAETEAWLKALNAALADPGWTSEVAPAWRAALPTYAMRWWDEAPERRRPETVVGLNRALLEAALPGVVLPRRPRALDLAPPRMLADPERDPAALPGFVAGFSNDAERLPIRSAPWRAWHRAFLFWGPLIFAMSVVTIGLALVVHRQWSHHEQLPYPTVEFIRALLPEGDRAAGHLFRERLFWIGFGLVFALHMVNYAHIWWPNYVIPIRRTLDLTPLLELAPVFRRGGAFGLFDPTLFFTAIGFAYFISSEVSLSLGLAPYLYALATGVAAGLGVAFGSGHLQLNIEAQLYAGAYTAMFVAVLYSGRHFYASVARRALGLPGGGAVDAAAVWGFRVAALGFFVFIGQLIVVGVEPGLALLYTLGAVMIFVTVSRLLAEGGVFFLHQHFYPCALLMSFLGPVAAGYDQMLILGLVSAMLLIDPREALMPFAVTGLRLAERAGARTGTVARWGMVGVLLALLVATPTMLYYQYRDGALRTGHEWMVNAVPRLPFVRAVSMTQALQAQGALESANRMRGFAQRLRRATPRPALMVAFFTTFGLVALFSFLRHRFAAWPLHPFLFLVLGTYQSRVMGFSFLLGWGVKKLVMKYGGAGLFQRVKPLMVGLVSGEVLAATMPLLVGALYTAATGRPAPSVRILP